MSNEKPHIAARFLRAAQMTTGAGVAARFLQSLLPFFVAKLISRSDFGIFTIVVSTVNLGAGLGESGQTATLQKFLPQFTVNEPESVGALVDTIIAIAMSCLFVLAAVLFLSSSLVATSLYGDPTLVNYLRVAAVILAGAGLFNVLCGTLAGLQEFGRYSAAQFVRSCVMLVLGVTGAALFGLTGVLAAQVVGSIALAYMAGRLASNSLHRLFGSRLLPRFDRRFIGVITGFSVPAFVSVILVLPAFWLAVARLSHFFGVQEVAEFGIAFGVMQFVILIPNVTSMTAMSFLSESHTRSDNTFSGLSNLNLRVAWGLALITAVFCAFTAPQLLHLVFGKKYGDLRWLLLFMMMAGLAMAICNSVGNVIASTGKMWQALGLNSFWLTLFVVFVIVFVPHLASRGLALSYFGSYGLFALLACLYGRYVCKMSLKKTPSLVALSCLGFASAAFTMDRWPQFLAAVGLLATSLLAAMGWYLVMTKRERAFAHAKLRAVTDRWTSRRSAAGSKERILYVSHVDWGWIKQRPQHLAEQLEQFFDVTVMFNGNWRRKNLVNRFRIGRRCIPLPRLPLRGRVPFIAMLDLFFTRAIVRLAIWLNRPDYIWLTWPDLDSYLPAKVKSSIVYDCMDNALAFPHEELRAARLESSERALIARADVVFSTSERLQRVLQSRYGTQKTFHLLRNAFDGKLLPVMPEKPPDQHPYKIGYCGTIAQWLDWDLLTKLTDKIPGVEIHLVGALDGGTSIVRHARIIWHEPVTHDRLPAVMAEFDCLAMPFVVTPLIESVDPVKLYEYINFGKPIVSVYYDEIARFTPFVHFYRTHDEALELVALLANGDLGRKYSESERQTFLASNSWNQRASLAATLLQKALASKE
jgi:teichuronic acid biosynthesis glycosyltransferase TuaH